MSTLPATQYINADIAETVDIVLGDPQYSNHRIVVWASNIFQAYFLKRAHPGLADKINAWDNNPRVYLWGSFNQIWQTYRKPSRRLGNASTIFNRIVREEAVGSAIEVMPHGIPKGSIPRIRLQEYLAREWSVDTTVLHILHGHGHSRNVVKGLLGTCETKYAETDHCRRA